nr:Rieske 2Fe-2S domain-containing protein [Deltaproteobacteria bacterium]
ENLALFRDESEKPGLLDIHCSHRAGDLSYGRIENGGLRCLYHGWLFDIHGNCLEQPGEPEGSKFKEKIKHPAYPCLEQAGVIFTYMGPGEAPLLPNYQFLTLGDPHRLVTKVHHECNYLQGNEGNIDPQHLSILHYFMTEQPGEAIAEAVQEGTVSSNALFGKDASPRIEVEETDFGIRIFAVREADEASEYVRITNFIYPNLAAFPAFPGVYGINWHVPIDDTHHWKYMFMVCPGAPLSKERIGPVLYDSLGPDYHITRNRSNRYLQDREEMKTRSFIGLGSSFALHDKWATEGEGDIQDRTKEHLGSTDKAVALQRRLLLRAICRVQEGGEAPHVVRDMSKNRMEHVGAYQEVVPKEGDWSSVWKKHVAA